MKLIDSGHCRVQLSRGVIEDIQQNKQGVVVRLKPRTPSLDEHNPIGGDKDAPTTEESYGEVVLCCLVDIAKKV